MLTEVLLWEHKQIRFQSQASHCLVQHHRRENDKGYDGGWLEAAKTFASAAKGAGELARLARQYPHLPRSG